MSSSTWFDARNRFRAIQRINNIRVITRYHQPGFRNFDSTILSAFSEMAAYTWTSFSGQEEEGRGRRRKEEEGGRRRKKEEGGAGENEEIT